MIENVEYLGQKMRFHRIFKLLSVLKYSPFSIIVHANINHLGNHLSKILKFVRTLPDFSVGSLELRKFGFERGETGNGQ